ECYGEGEVVDRAEHERQKWLPPPIPGCPTQQLVVLKRFRVHPLRLLNRAGPGPLLLIRGGELICARRLVPRRLVHKAPVLWRLLTHTPLTLRGAALRGRHAVLCAVGAVAASSRARAQSPRRRRVN